MSNLIPLYVPLCFFLASSLLGSQCWNLLRGNNLLITSVKRVQAKKEKKEKEERLGQAQGMQAVQRQAGNEHSARRNAGEEKNSIKSENGFTERGRKREVHLGICEDNILPPLEA
ncbi:unnamed protein product [Pleuronectes platessa]|uniref:Uncharacterized protein n=1 Tax=Pleuronectes platessa TaxID=8262 RepID=A0A9N7UGX4_PLEPL|nr:unnamed protein product [Pleuronectes platessa]